MFIIRSSEIIVSVICLALTRSHNPVLSKRLILSCLKRYITILPRLGLFQNPPGRQRILSSSSK
jgi:hypothetical protein